jgi:hypothetical protein
MANVISALRVRARTAGNVVLAPLRRGHRRVQMTPERGVGLGNHAYLWLHAYLQQQDGRDHRVLAPSSLKSWFDLFPRVRHELCLDMDELRLLDDRKPWTFELPDEFGVDFSRQQLHDFVREMLIPSIGSGDQSDDTVVVNVRRGDYYSVPANRGRYGFDYLEYLRIALDEAVQGGGQIRRCSIVSDDPAWCRTKLHAELQKWAPEVTYVSPSASPQKHFLQVARARRLIGANSTFSYWAGYTSNVLHEERSQVIVPLFHGRFPSGSDAYQIDPSWTVVRDIPGGWDG